MRFFFNYLRKSVSQVLLKFFGDLKKIFFRTYRSFNRPIKDLETFVIILHNIKLFQSYEIIIDFKNFIDLAKYHINLNKGKDWCDFFNSLQIRFSGSVKKEKQSALRKFL